MVEIKYRTPELLATMHRIDPVIAKLKARPHWPVSPLPGTAQSKHDLRAAMQTSSASTYLQCRSRSEHLNAEHAGKLDTTWADGNRSAWPLQAEMPPGFEGTIKAREAELLPVYRQVSP